MLIVKREQTRTYSNDNDNDKTYIFNIYADTRSRQVKLYLAHTSRSLNIIIHRIYR